MDALILSLTPPQHKKYLELLKQDTVTLEFKVDKIEFENYSDENINNAKIQIVACCEALMNFAKSDSFFSAKLSKNEIDKIIPKYYGAINNISNIQRELYREAITVSGKIKEL